MNEGICRHCLGEKRIRNPSGYCDHLRWPDNLSPMARVANRLEAAGEDYTMNMDSMTTTVGNNAWRRADGTDSDVLAYDYLISNGFALNIDTLNWTRDKEPDAVEDHAIRYLNATWKYGVFISEGDSPMGRGWPTPARNLN